MTSLKTIKDYGNYLRKYLKGRLMKLIWIKKHKKNCGSIRSVLMGTWPDPWAYPEICWVKNTLWIRFICNSTPCKGAIRVKFNEMVDKLELPKT